MSFLFCECFGIFSSVIPKLMAALLQLANTGKYLTFFLVLIFPGGTWEMQPFSFLKAKLVLDLSLSF